MAEDTPHPEWAKRLRRERIARDWSAADAVAALRTFAAAPLPADLMTRWERWECGRGRPDELYRPLIAAAFGTVVESIFPSGRRERHPADPVDRPDLVRRLARSSVDHRTLSALSAVVEQLCCDYSGRDAGELLAESREWLAHLAPLREAPPPPAQHRDVLDAAGWLTLLIGCLEYDLGRQDAAEITRRAALELAAEGADEAVAGWAHEMRAWFALTAGRYREAIAAAQAGRDAAPGRSVTAQMLAQEAKAWARLGEGRNALHALERSRRLLDSLPYPQRPDNHFVVDPDKFDVFAMECYRLLGEDRLAEVRARQIVATSVRDGRIVSPMRLAEAQLTLGVIAARGGTLEEALAHGHAALGPTRRSQPTLLMVGTELHHALRERYPDHPAVDAFRAALAGATG